MCILMAMYINVCMCILVYICMLGYMHEYVYVYVQVCMGMYILYVFGCMVTAIRTHSCDPNSVTRGRICARYEPDTLAI